MPEKDSRAKRLEELFEAPAFQALPLTISARLAEGEVPLVQVRDLSPGQIVPLRTPVGESSQLIAEGITIGQGEIVEIQGKLAFRVTRLGGGA
jgi:flagellar motor switch/type III secretory pathway protein FliN